MMTSLGWMREIGISGFLDVLFMWVVVYAFLVWSKKTRSASILTGIMIVAGVYLLTRQLNMVLAASLLEKFFAIILIALVVIFQEELRSFFEQIAEWSLNRRLGRAKTKTLTRDEVDVLTKTLVDLASEKVGALIVIRGKDLMIRHMDGGIELEGKISEALLKSLFDASSIGHDGAVYIEGNKIIRFSCHLPLSTKLEKLGKGGTRHAAALGLSELCDALCLVVSEERGKISVAQNGEIKIISKHNDLKNIINEFYANVYPVFKVKPWKGFLKKNSREKIIGLILACLIWFVLVYGNKQTYKTFTVPVHFQPMPAEFSVPEVRPEKVYITLGGPRNSFFFLSPKKIKLTARPEIKRGVQKVRIYPSDVDFPKELTMELLAPNEIEFRIDELKSTVLLSEDVQKGIIDKVKKALPGGKEKLDEVKVEPPVSVESASLPLKSVTPTKKTEKVPFLEDAKPDDVAKYLGSKFDSKEILEPLKPESKT